MCLPNNVAASLDPIVEDCIAVSDYTICSAVCVLTGQASIGHKISEAHFAIPPERMRDRNG